MAIKMVREPSETPNINNIDDIVPMRYAYGNQNGYVIGKGNEISNSVSGLNFTVNSGRLVLQGVECDIDATGVTITIDNIATKRYYTVYLEVNLGLNIASIKDEYDTATYPTIETGDDLTANSTGIARMVLYKFTATSGVIGEVNKVVESIKYTSNMSVANCNLVQNVDLSSPNSATFGNYIIPKKIVLWQGIFNNGDLKVDGLNIGDEIEIEWYFLSNDRITKTKSKGIIAQISSNNIIYPISFPFVLFNTSSLSVNRSITLNCAYMENGDLRFRGIYDTEEVNLYANITITKISKIIE